MMKWAYEDGVLVLDGLSVFSPEESLKEKVTKIILIDGVRYIEARAFKDFKKLKEIYIPESLAQVKREAFENCVNLQFDKNTYTEMVVPN